MIREAVLLYPAQATDDNGDPTGSVPDSVEVEGCQVVPRTSSEEQGYIPLSGYLVVLPAGAGLPWAAVAADWLVGVRGRAKQEIEGVPADFLRRGILIYTRRIGSPNA